MRATVCIHRPAPQPRTFITGEILLWCPTVVKFPEGNLQVPAVIIDDGQRVHEVPLRTATTWATIERTS